MEPHHEAERVGDETRPVGAIGRGRFKRLRWARLEAVSKRLRCGSAAIQRALSKLRSVSASRSCSEANSTTRSSTSRCISSSPTWVRRRANVPASALEKLPLFSASAAPSSNALPGRSSAARPLRRAAPGRRRQHRARAARVSSTATSTSVGPGARIVDAEARKDPESRAGLQADAGFRGDGEPGSRLPRLMKLPVATRLA